MFRLCVVLSAAALLLPAQAPGPRKISAPNASVQAMLAYPLTLPNLERYAQASRAMTALIAKDSGLLPKLKPTPGDAPNTVDETVVFTKKHCPECLATVEKFIPYREYVLFQGGLLISYVSAIRPRASSQVHVSPDNLKFILANRPKIEAILAEQRQQPGTKASGAKALAK